MYLRIFQKRPQYLCHLISILDMTNMDKRRKRCNWLFVVSKREKFARNANGLKALLK